MQQVQSDRFYRRAFKLKILSWNYKQDYSRKNFVKIKTSLSGKEKMYNFR